MIIKVALKHDDGSIFMMGKPKRHHHIIRLMHDEHTVMNISEFDQGFMTDTGEFLGRKEAGVHAIECGQIEKLKWPTSLFSEDLW